MRGAGRLAPHHPNPRRSPQRVPGARSLAPQPLALWVAEFFTMLGISMFLPFLPLYLRQLGVTEPGKLEVMSGLIFAAPFFAATVATPVWGFLGDRHGRKLM